MSHTDHSAQARSYVSTASAATRKAGREAGRAAENYRTAKSMRRHAAWLAGRPDLWDPSSQFTPADLEAQARTWTRLGDIYLRSSFRADVNAEFYRNLAGQYRAMAARRAASIAGLAAS